MNGFTIAVHHEDAGWVATASDPVTGGSAWSAPQADFAEAARIAARTLRQCQVAERLRVDTDFVSIEVQELSRWVWRQLRHERYWAASWRTGTSSGTYTSTDRATAVAGATHNWALNAAIRQTKEQP